MCMEGNRLTPIDRALAMSIVLPAIHKQKSVSVRIFFSSNMIHIFRQPPSLKMKQKKM